MKNRRGKKQNKISEEQSKDLNQRTNMCIFSVKRLYQDRQSTYKNIGFICMSETFRIGLSLTQSPLMWLPLAKCAVTLSPILLHFITAATTVLGPANSVLTN